MEFTRDEKIILEELQKIMEAMGIDYIPSHSIISTYNSAILSRISRNGGIKKLSEKFNIQLGSRNSHKKRITNNDLIKSIQGIVNELKLERFPSAKEIRDCTRDSSLTSLISHRGGFKFWADKMGYKLKESETTTGWIGEEIAKKLLDSNGYLAEKMNTNCAYDFIDRKSVV